MKREADLCWAEGRKEGGGGEWIGFCPCSLGWGMWWRDGCRVQSAPGPADCRVEMDCCGFVVCNADRGVRGGAPVGRPFPTLEGGRGGLWYYNTSMYYDSGSFEEWCGAGVLITALRTGTKVGFLLRVLNLTSIDRRCITHSIELQYRARE